MKSVKPGRGPSMMNAAGSIFAILFGIIWTAIAMSSGAPFFFSLFGICFIGLAVVQAVYNFKNATGKNRYSAFDIVDEGEENDPLNERFGGEREIREAVMRERAQIAEAAKTANAAQSVEMQENIKAADGFCPYCGTEAESDFEFCKKCGKRLPKD